MEQSSHSTQVIRTADIWVDELARGVRMRLTNDPGILRQSDLVARRKPDSVRRGQSGHLPDEFQRGRWQGAAAGVEDLRRGMAHELVSRWQVHPLRARKLPGNPIQDVWVLPLVGDRKPRLFVQNAFDGQFSPDGRWVAYTSMESGKIQIYVVPFDATKVLDTAPGAVTSRAANSRFRPAEALSPGGEGTARKSFTCGRGKQMMAAEVDGRGNSFAARKEQALFKLPEGFGWYDVTPDGKRFVMITQKVAIPTRRSPWCVNWTALLGNKP